MLFPDLTNHSKQLMSLVHQMQVTIQSFMERLLSDPYGPIHLVHFDLVRLPVCPEPLNGVEEYFFLMSTPYSFSANSIIFSRKSILICFCPTTRSISRTSSLKRAIFTVSLLASTTCLIPFLRTAE